jgi:hypothetical protein
MCACTLCVVRLLTFGCGAGAGGEVGELVAGVSRAYSRPARQEEDHSPQADASEASLEELMAQMKSI